MVSSTQPDFSRETPTRFFDPSRKLLRHLRGYQSWLSSKAIWAPLIRRYHSLLHKFWTIVTGADIPLNCSLGGGLLIPHPNGIVIHPAAKIGPNCLIFQQVTIGAGGKLPGVPQIAGHVDIGAGAKLLGGIQIGEHAKIGANAVVLCDVPPYATAVGIPARIMLGAEQPVEGPTP